MSNDVQRHLAQVSSNFTHRRPRWAQPPHRVEERARVIDTETAVNNVVIADRDEHRVPERHVGAADMTGAEAPQHVRAVLAARGIHEIGRIAEAAAEEARGEGIRQREHATCGEHRHDCGDQLLKRALHLMSSIDQGAETRQHWRAQEHAWTS